MNGSGEWGSSGDREAESGEVELREAELREAELREAEMSADERPADSEPNADEPSGQGDPESRPADAARRALRAARERREGREGQEEVSRRHGGTGSSMPGDATTRSSELGSAGSAGRGGASPVGEGTESGERPSAGEESTRERHDHPAARPGDEARAALRRAVHRDSGAAAGSAADTVRADASASGSGSGSASASASAAEGTPAEVSDAATGRQGVRPADVAREALRAALGERRRAQAEAADRGASETRRSRRSAPAGSEGARSTRGGAEGRRDAGGSSEVRRARDVRGLLAGAFRMPPLDSPPTPPPTTPSSETTGALSSTGSGSAPAPVDPATPQVPRSMAAPGRDGELRRTFPAFAPRACDHGDARFAETWWGNAWVSALEEGALDPKRLARGRGYAEQGHVDAITVTPGLVLGYVQGSRPRPYRVQVRLRTLGDDDWARFLDAAADRPGHIAALLDKEMPHSLAECGVPLLPGPGDLDPHCSCPDRGHPCKHAAALCYQTARLLDADPFVLLLLRGRGERALLDALSRRNATRAARAAQERAPEPLPGVRATDALAPDRRLPPLPAPLPAPAHPEQPPVYPAAPGGPDPFALDQLATDAAARAHALLSTGRDPVGELTLWQDAVRLAAARPGSGLTATTRALYSSLASAADRTPAELARAVAAWRQGGPEGLAVLEEPWDPPAGRFDRARPLLLAADLPAFRPWRNRLTHPRGHVQLRLGRDGLWYPYESEPGHDDWWPHGTPDLDPVGALTGLGTSPEG
ncbi:SWIM zinc finger family protein [Streptomyces sp. AS02]|uniref:SWIM zinc finger family protein n=1 Tax=Streptomyces sp. AS02 TaxID=2938946 RepID=UPI002021241A|nr:SWIM zinc finger family protein [Streptomyces sp. AS02]MCL8013184.1 SWIM zinc finger family protein [Streptomyces sp. AS02]